MLENLYNSLKYAGNFTQFLELIEFVGLLEELKSFDQFSVFAPNDEVFDKLSKLTIENLYKDIEKTKRIINFHIIPGKILMNELENMPYISNKDVSLNIIKNSDGMYVKNAKIISSDHEAINGVYYEIDSLINPKEEL